MSTARTHSLTAHDSSPAPGALTAGWSLGFLVAAGVMVLAAVVTTTMITTYKQGALDAR